MQKLVFLFIALIFSSLAFSQSLNKLNEKGQKEGRWVVPYANSSVIRYEGQFKNGEPYGKFIFYGPRIIKQKELDYRTPDVAMAKFFDDNGIIKAEGKYVNEKRDSLWRFYKGGQLSRVDEYVDGELNGKSISYFDNGRPAVIGFYSDGVQDSIQLDFSKNGKLIEETSYKNNKKNGPFTSYYINGKKELEGVYFNDEFDDTLKSYNDDGSLRMVVEFENGLEVSKRYVNSVNDVYYDDGVMQSTETYKNGVKEGLVKEWYSNYEWIMEEGFDKQTNRNEVYKTLKNYTVKMEGNYRQGKKDGVFNYYNEDGNLIESVTYKMGEKVNK